MGEENQLDLSLFKQMGDQYQGVFFIYDLSSHRFIYVNAGFEDVWKKKISEISDNPRLLLDTIHPEDRLYIEENYRKFEKEQTKLTLSFRIEWPYVIDRWIGLTVFPLQQPGNAKWVAGIADDDSARKKNIFLMQKINARKDSLIEILAHDLMGPIGMVQNLAALIKKKLPKPDDHQVSEWLNLIEKICKRNVEMIRDLVHHEFIESTEVEISKERLDLVWEINEVVENYRNSQDKLAKVFKITSSDPAVFAHVDSMKFMQIINNLVSNAMKFTGENGLIHIHVEKKEKTSVISVYDNGIGIPKDLQPFLFDRFTKARRPGLKGEESVGLGMSIIKTMVEMHKGKIWFESEENKGSTFYIEIGID